MTITDVILTGRDVMTGFIMTCHFDYFRCYYDHHMLLLLQKSIEQRCHDYPQLLLQQNGITTTAEKSYVMISIIIIHLICKALFSTQGTQNNNNSNNPKHRRQIKAIYSCRQIRRT